MFQNKVPCEPKQNEYSVLVFSPLPLARPFAFCRMVYCQAAKCSREQADFGFERPSFCYVKYEGIISQVDRAT